MIRKFFKKIKIGGSIEHERFSENQKKIIRNKYNLSNSFLCDENGLNKERMKKYGYLCL